MNLVCITSLLIQAVSMEAWTGLVVEQMMVPRIPVGAQVQVEMAARIEPQAQVGMVMKDQIGGGQVLVEMVVEETGARAEVRMTD
jgi:hypothetical protein